MKPMLSTLLFLLISTHAAIAASQTVAVLPSEGDLNPSELEYLTNKAQEIAVRVLPRGTFEVFPRDVIIRRLGGVENYLKECREASCIVDLGKKAQVDYVSQCTFGRLGSDLTIAFELYNVSTSGLVDKFTERAKDIEDLLAVMERRIPDGFAKILEAPPETKTEPPPPEHPPPPPEPAAVPVPSEPATVPEPVPPAAVENVEGSGSVGEDSGKVFSLGIRAGFNFSHLSSDNGSYNSAIGFQSGLVLDIALNDLFHIQPGLMYIQKGAEDNNGIMTLHYIEIPLQLSLKFSALRVNAGPYFGICLDANTEHSASSFDFGLSAGLGFDIWMFHIGVFYDYGLTEFSSIGKYKLYNRTLGLNLGVNL